MVSVSDIFKVLKAVANARTAAHDSINYAKETGQYYVHLYLLAFLKENKLLIEDANPLQIDSNLIEKKLIEYYQKLGSNADKLKFLAKLSRNVFVLLFNRINDSDLRAQMLSVVPDSAKSAALSLIENLDKKSGDALADTIIADPLVFRTNLDEFSGKMKMNPGQLVGWAWAGILPLSFQEDVPCTVQRKYTPETFYADAIKTLENIADLDPYEYTLDQTVLLFNDPKKTEALKVSSDLTDADIESTTRRGLMSVIPSMLDKPKQDNKKLLLAEALKPLVEQAATPLTQISTALLRLKLKINAKLNTIDEFEYKNDDKQKYFIEIAKLFLIYKKTVSTSSEPMKNENPSLNDRQFRQNVANALHKDIALVDDFVNDETNKKAIEEKVREINATQCYLQTIAPIVKNVSEALSGVFAVTISKYEKEKRTGDLATVNTLFDQLKAIDATVHHHAQNLEQLAARHSPIRIGEKVPEAVVATGAPAQPTESGPADPLLNLKCLFYTQEDGRYIPLGETYNRGSDPHFYPIFADELSADSQQFFSTAPMSAKFLRADIKTAIQAIKSLLETDASYNESILAGKLLQLIHLYEKYDSFFTINRTIGLAKQTAIALLIAKMLGHKKFDEAVKDTTVTGDVNAVLSDMVKYLALDAPPETKTHFVFKHLNPENQSASEERSIGEVLSMRRWTPGYCWWKDRTPEGQDKANTIATVRTKPDTGSLLEVKRILGT